MGPFFVFVLFCLVFSAGDQTQCLAHASKWSTELHPKLEFLQIVYLPQLISKPSSATSQLWITGKATWYAKTLSIGFLLLKSRDSSGEWHTSFMTCHTDYMWLCMGNAVIRIIIHSVLFSFSHLSPFIHVIPLPRMILLFFLFLQTWYARLSSNVPLPSCPLPGLFQPYPLMQVDKLVCSCIYHSVLMSLPLPEDRDCDISLGRTSTEHSAWHRRSTVNANWRV